ncbi:flagellar assembly protein A [Desulfobacter latus]|uniref:DUF342 domain-containing protein n=1 Tax=Desulfobacter latus TaxID=2292 RepID=A0A850TGM1_9BACT|nr:flagellar assembly protein A [Desulfobacter latus]NWH06676.1 DUF342 domain-containing protein [Desulfobacter latus]
MSENTGNESNLSQSRILIVESDEILGGRIEQIFTRGNYAVRRVNSAYGALAAVEDAEKYPFAVVICMYRMPRMAGDELLKNVKSMAPDTQRVLLIDSIEITTVISAVNRAGIHNCIPVPFHDEMLYAEVSQRAEYFEKIKKKERLLRLTKVQNRQLYNMALTLKEKKQSDALEIQKKNKLLKTLKLRPETSVEKKETAGLEALLSKKHIDLTPESFLQEFNSQAWNIKCFIENLAADGIVALKEIDEQLSQQSQDVITGIDSSCPPVPAGLLTGPSFKKMVNDPYVKKICDTLLKDQDWIDHSLVDQIVSAFIEAEFCRVEPAPGVPKVRETGNLNDVPFHLTISKDQMSASVEQKVHFYDFSQALKQIKALLNENQICFGIKDDGLIDKWLSETGENKKHLVVATGKKPVPPENAKVIYYFDVDFRQPGVVDSEGNMDFRERGAIPYVKSGVLLAEKKKGRSGRSGTDIFGNTLTVEPPEDVIFESGKNTILSGDKLKILSTDEGQPHLDAMGIVSVYPELRIKGDVGFKTGNIYFSGNLTVSGAIREGFSVKCVNLTVDQIQGAEIDITGDLNVSQGITDADIINVQGVIQAKYINNSQVKSFGDIIVQREIIDSSLFTGGACINEGGSIIASTINARTGVRAGSIGTDKTLPARFEVGTEGLMEILIAQLDGKIEANNHAMEEMEKKIENLIEQERMLSDKISKAAFEQEGSQRELQALKNKLPTFKKDKENEPFQEILESMQLLTQRADDAEGTINQVFAQQEEIRAQIQVCNKDISAGEEDNEALMFRKRGIEEFAKRIRPKPELIVQKEIVAGTVIVAEKSRLRLNQTQRHCKFREIKRPENVGALGYEIMIINL